MENIDTIRKTLGHHKTKRGPNTNPGFFTWYTLFQYMLYQTFRVYSYHLMENEMEKMKSFLRFQDKRKHIMSFKEFLNILSIRDSFCISEFDELYPGLKDKFNRKMNSPSAKNDQNELVANTKKSDTDLTSDNNVIPKKKKYKVLDRFNDPSSQEYNTRLNKKLLHTKEIYGQDHVI